jgi:hypothetical protein
MAQFNFKDFVEKNELSTELQDVLSSAGFNTFLAIKNAAIQDIKELKVGPGHRVHIISAIKCVQEANGGGPLCDKPIQDNTPSLGGLEALLSRMDLHAPQARGLTAARGETYHKIIDFLPSGVVAVEEEVALGAGLTLKMNSKPKLEKVSPAAWIVANSRIMGHLLADPKFNAVEYLRYSEMIGELGCRYTWQSVLLFDDEYRQRQWTEQFPWGTSAPHLSTVVLRDRALQPFRPSNGRGGAPASSSQRAGHTSAAGRKETCRQFNRGQCSYGGDCIYRHACATCGGPHPARDHGQSSADTPTAQQ